MIVLWNQDGAAMATEGVAVGVGAADGSAEGVTVGIDGAGEEVFWLVTLAFSTSGSLLLFSLCTWLSLFSLFSLALSPDGEP